MLIETLLDNLQAGVWKPGDRLPSEREIGEGYGASRTVVREALSALQLAGYVEARPGDATYVLRTHLEQPAQNMGSTVQAGLSVAEVLEAREALDISALYLAIENAADEELQPIAEIIAEMEEAIASKSYGRYIALTLDFHNAIASAGGNAFVRDAIANLIDRVRSSMWIVKGKYTPEIAGSSLRDHQAILDAVRCRDLGAAIEAARNHYRNYPVNRRSPGC